MGGHCDMGWSDAAGTEPHFSALGGALFGGLVNLEGPPYEARKKGFGRFAALACHTRGLAPHDGVPVASVGVRCWRVADLSWGRPPKGGFAHCQWGRFEALRDRAICRWPQPSPHCPPVFQAIHLATGKWACRNLYAAGKWACRPTHPGPLSHPPPSGPSRSDDSPMGGPLLEA